MSQINIARPKLLVLELWALGDLAIATPFLQRACKEFEVTLLAKPQAVELGAQFFPSVKVAPFVAPWTAFRHKYRLLKWPWREFFRLRKLCEEEFDVGLSARRDPRDHALLRLMRISRRIGFPRYGSQVLLTQTLKWPGADAHRYECWRALGDALDLNLPARENLEPNRGRRADLVVVHTGAGHKVRVWPLERYQTLVDRLRKGGFKVQIVCDRDQQEWWQSVGESDMFTPRTIKELTTILQTGAVFIGNDSGPGHLAALSGVPTFTLFGPQLPQWFVPLHPSAEWLTGMPCPYKPCWDSCRFATPNCLWGLDIETVWARIEPFVAKHLRKASTI